VSAALDTFVLLDRRTGWRAAPETTAAVGDDLRLQPLPGRERPLVDDSGSLGGIALPVGLAVAPDQRIYILDGERAAVKRFDPCTRRFETLPCCGGEGVEPRRLLRPSGIAVSPREDLYVSEVGNRRVQVFGLKGLVLRAIWGPLRVVRDGAGEVCGVEPVEPEFSLGGGPEPELTYPAATWEPRDVACRDCRVYVSDHTNGVVHAFDETGRWLAAYRGDPAAPFVHPTHLAVDLAGRIYVLQEGEASVVVLGPNGAFEGLVTQPSQLSDRFRPLAVDVAPNGDLYLTGAGGGVRVYAATANGHSFTGSVRSNGDGWALAFDRAGNALVGDRGRIIALDGARAFPLDAQYVSTALDSRTYRCSWHRVALRTDIPTGTRIRVDTFSSEAEKSDDEIANLPDERWQTGITNASVGSGEWDCLVCSAPGRYLWLRLALLGDGAATPVIDRVEVEFPRRSSLGYLPAAYSENPDGRDFLDRFLSIFDGVRDRVRREADAVTGYLDPAASPVEPVQRGGIDFLSWLGSWLGLSIEASWPEQKRRRLVAAAHELFRLRGTPAGMRRHIELYAGVEPQILEHFKLRRLAFLEGSRLGENATLWGDAIVARLKLDEFSRIGSFRLIDSGDPLRDPFHHFAHRFTVFVPLSRGGTDLERRTIERIVELSKPAHTEADVQIIRPRFRVGVQALVGIDTVVGDYPDRLVEHEGTLGYDTVLGPSQDERAGPALRVGKRSRIGTSTLID
jgi:phage tail-like protein